MNKYEMLYILKSDLSDEARDAVIAKFENIVKNAGGSVEKTDKWGVRKLAYDIDYKSEGFYVLMTFEAQTSLVVEMERIANITDGIIRRMITKR